MKTSTTASVTTPKFARALVLAAGLSTMLVLMPATALGQWTSDPTANTIVADGAGDQGIPIVLPIADGSTWVVHTDNAAGGYKYAIQKLTGTGTRAFAQSIVLSPTRTNSATFLIDAQTFPSGEAVVAYDDNGVYVQKVAADGSLPWAGSGSGVQMPGSAGALGPSVCAFPDGSVVVCWAGPNVTLNFQRIEPNGSLGAAWTYTESASPVRPLLPSDLVATGTGRDFIAMWTRATGTGFTAGRGLKVQKWDSTNAQAWNGGVPKDLYASSSTAPLKSIQAGYFPRLIADGRGGAVVAWYDTGATRNAWLQHVQPDGSFKFSGDGVAMSSTPSSTELRVSASVAFLPGGTAAGDEYVVAYQRTNASQSQQGLGAQRVDASGATIWGGGAGQGLIAISAASNISSFINVNPAPAVGAGGAEAFVTWLQYGGAAGPMTTFSTRLATDGTTSTAWPADNGGFVTVGSPGTYKGRLAVANLQGSSSLIACWAEAGVLNAPNDVKAMRINANGSLGQPTCGLSDVAGANQSVGADGVLTADDIIVFLGWFFSDDARANVAGPNQSTVPDNALTADDIIVFLARYFAGC